MESERWPGERSWAWYTARPWMLGFNFVPSTACNTTQMWQADTYDSTTIDRELGWAAAIGFNSARVFVQYMVWRDDPDGLKSRFRALLEMANRRGISIVPVLFDDCAFGAPPTLDPYLGRQNEPTPGMILPSWTPSPGVQLGTDLAEQPRLRDYVQDLITTFAPHPAIAFWDLFNEPGNIAKVGTADFLTRLFAWARELAPPQPLTVGTFNDEHPALNHLIHHASDIITFHTYANLDGLLATIGALQPLGYPLLCTEWMARGQGSRIESHLPLFHRHQIACYQWGLVNGRTQCQYPWSNHPGDPVPREGWFHDLLHADGTAYRTEEVEAVRRLRDRT